MSIGPIERQPAPNCVFVASARQRRAAGGDPVGTVRGRQERPACRRSRAASRSRRRRARSRACAGRARCTRGRRRDGVVGVGVLRPHVEVLAGAGRDDGRLFGRHVREARQHRGRGGRRAPRRARTAASPSSTIASATAASASAATGSRRPRSRGAGAAPPRRPARRARRAALGRNRARERVGGGHARASLGRAGATAPRSAASCSSSVVIGGSLQEWRWQGRTAAERAPARAASGPCRRGIASDAAISS